MHLASRDIESDVDLAAFMARRLERNEARRTGKNKAQARATIADRLGVSPGTFENLDRGRLKDVSSRLVKLLARAFIHDAEQELRRIEHEMEMVRQAGSGSYLKQIDALEKRRAALRRALADEPAPRVLDTDE